MRRTTTGLLLAAIAATVMGCGGTSEGVDNGATTTVQRTATTLTSDHGGESGQNRREHEATRLSLTINGDEVSGDTKPTVSLGSEVTLRVRSDHDDTLHVHGYDRELQVTAGKVAAITFTADIAGRFEVELHHGGGKVMELTVK